MGKIIVNAICTCGKDSFIIYRTSIECNNCAKTYYFNTKRLFSDIIDLVREENIVNKVVYSSKDT